MPKKYLKPKAWNHYPAEDLEARGDEVVKSNLPENIATIAIGLGVLVVVAVLWWFLG